MIFQLIIMFFPWAIRRRLLIWSYGYEIDKTARIGKSIILAHHLKMAPKSRIHNGIICKRIDLLEMGEDSGIASLTFITGFSVNGCRHFRHVQN